MRKAIVTLCALVGLAMPATANGLIAIDGESYTTILPDCTCHTYVEKGDSLWKISKEVYGTGRDYTKIADANGIKSPYIIHPDQRLFLP